MKIFSWAMAIVSAMLFMCGCSENALDYVPENADYVVYGNTNSFLSSKIWKVLKKSEGFEDKILDNFEAVLGIDKSETLLGNAAVWGKVSEKPEGAVIFFSKGGAGSIFDHFRKNYENNKFLKIESNKIDGNDAFSVYYESEEKKNYSFGLVKEDDNVLHIIFGDKASIHKKVGRSEVANAVDRNAIAAIATKSGAWMDVVEKNASFKEIDLDFGKAGVAKIEVFCDNKEISIKGSVDISELDD